MFVITLTAKRETEFLRGLVTSHFLDHLTFTMSLMEFCNFLIIR